MRTFHGTADVSIDLHDPAATLRDVIVATTGQAAPVAATVDGRVVNTGDTLGVCRVMVGSVINTDLDAIDDDSEVVTTLVQLTGQGAGRTVALAAGHYRIGSGRRASSAELSFEYVDTVAFDLHVTATGIRVSRTVQPQSPTVFLNNEVLTTPRDWVAGHLIAGTRTFALDVKRPTTRSVDWQAVNPDGTIVHNRPPGQGDELVFMVDAVRHSRDRDSRLWHRRLHDGPLFADIGLIAYHGEPEKSGTLRRPPAPPPKRRLTASIEFDIDRVVALAGTENDRTALARALIIDLTTRYGPADADIVIATNPSTLADWDWMKWLPHVHDNGAVQILTNELEMSTFANSAVADSQRADRPAHMTVVVVTHDDLWNAASSPLRSLVLEGPRSLAVIALTNDRSTAPATTGALVSLDPERPGAAKLVSLTQGGDDVPLLVGLVDLTTADAVARRLAPLVDPDRPNSRAGLGPPADTTLSAMLRADEAELRWDTGLGAVDNPVEIPIGSIAGVPIGIDLGANSGILVSGSSLAEATGVASMITLAAASTWSPKETTVVTIDHRTERHDDVVQLLPHHAGTYSERGPDAGRRLIERLRAAVLGPDRTHPRLIVVVNGAADSELAVPGLTADLAVLASEAVGFHLVVATALPLASLDPLLRAVCPIEIAVDRYGGTRRATLHDPGRRLHSPFTPPDDSVSVDRAVEVRPLVFGRQPTALERRLERGPLVAPEPGDHATTRVARALRSLAHDRGDQPALPLLPMPLPSTISVTELFAAHRGDGVPLGLVERHDELAPTPYWWKPGAHGSHLVFGSPRSGMRSALDTLIVGVIDRFATADIQLSLIDHNDHRRDSVALAPHVVRAVSSDHPGDLAELLADVVDTMHRRTVRSDFRINDHSRVILCIRDVDRLPSEAQPTLVDLLINGAAVGVNLIASATRPDGLGDLIAACPDILVGELSERSDYDAFGLSRSPILEQRSGRCRQLNGDVVQLATLDQSFDATVRDMVSNLDGGTDS